MYICIILTDLEGLSRCVLKSAGEFIDDLVAFALGSAHPQFELDTILMSQHCKVYKAQTQLVEATKSISIST